RWSAGAARYARRAPRAGRSAFRIHAPLPRARGDSRPWTFDASLYIMSKRLSNLMSNLTGNRLPVLREMIRRAPRERLRGERGIAGAAAAHDRRAEHADVRCLVREAPAIDDVRLR